MSFLVSAQRPARTTQTQWTHTVQQFAAVLRRLQAVTPAYIDKTDILSSGPGPSGSEKAYLQLFSIRCSPSRHCWRPGRAGRVHFPISLPLSLDCDTTRAVHSAIKSETLARLRARPPARVDSLVVVPRQPNRRYQRNCYMMESPRSCRCCCWWRCARGVALGDCDSSGVS